jgi:hypothetical protein
MLTQEVRTELSPTEVVQRAKDFFLSRFSPSAGFVAEQSDHHVKFEVDSGEVVIGAMPEGEATRVRASSSRLHHSIGQFLATLAPPEEVRDGVAGAGVSGSGGS